ncbi:MAG: hypothetical protein R2704_00120 [Microthrixaceae bacterium]
MGKPSDPLASARELAVNFRDQGRLITEPYDAEVVGTPTAVLAIRGSEDDYRSDHFLIHDGNGMAVMGVDPSSFDAADELARRVIPTVTA